MARIYVADLAAYVEGRLVGQWLDLDDYVDAGDLQYVIERDVLQPNHEEWAIHDYEGFGPIRIDEYESLDTVMMHNSNMGDEPNKYFAWMEARGDADGYDPDMVFGPYESESDYFDQWLDSCYGAMDVETVLTNVGVDPCTAQSLSYILQWVDADRFVRDSGNPLVEIRTGEYSREFYEVEQ